jgi:predicted O-linked N-acetylglucosamine transferase (SPINDLY family)
LKKNKIDQLANEAVSLENIGKLYEAEVIYTRLIKLHPEVVNIIKSLDSIKVNQSEINYIVKLNKLYPYIGNSIFKLGTLCLYQNKVSESKNFLIIASKLYPVAPQPWINLGKVYWKLGDLKEARVAFENATKFKPLYAESFDLLGSVVSLLEGNRFSEPFFRKAVEIQPNLASARCNLGICCFYLGNIGEAVTHLAKAIEINPKLAHAHSALGLVLEKSLKLNTALEAYKYAVKLEPTNAQARSSALLLSQYLDCNQADLSNEHKEFGKIIESKYYKPKIFKNSKDKDKKIRVGLISPDFRMHAVTFFIEPILEGISKEDFDIYLYHDHVIIDEVSMRLKALCLGWSHINGLNDDHVERIISDDSIDILIDLAGHTGFNRLTLFARRVAPVQISYLGYPDTTGLTTIDYRFVDHIADPVGNLNETYYTEKLFRFSSCAWVYKPYKINIELSEDREGPIVFGCFNNYAKITDHLLTCWSFLLKAIPDSRICIKGMGHTAGMVYEDAWNRIVKSGLPKERVEILNRVEKIEDHLSLYNKIDVCLDTFPYNGTTTTCESLWMGVPVITMKGDRHISRVSMSILNAIGQNEWVAEGKLEYLKLAAKVALERPRTYAMRNELRNQMSKSILVDSRHTSSKFAEALKLCWKQWCEKL